MGFSSALSNWTRDRWSRFLDRSVGNYLLHTSVARTFLFNLFVALTAALLVVAVATVWTFGVEFLSNYSNTDAINLEDLNTDLDQIGLRAEEFPSARVQSYINRRFKQSAKVKSLCITKGGKDIELLGVANTANMVTLLAVDNCARAKEENILPIVIWSVASQDNKLGSSLLPEYRINVFDKNLADLVYSRIYSKIDNIDEDGGRDKANIAAQGISQFLFTYLNTGNQLKRYETLAKTSSVFHRAVLFVFLFGVIGSLLIYYHLTLNTKARSQYSLEEVRSRLRFYHEIIHVLPTVSLICTMIGLMYTLTEFLGRGSPDPTQALASNSAALGGIILAFTTTVMASLLFIVGWNFVVITADERLAAEYESDKRTASARKAIE